MLRLQELIYIMEEGRGARLIKFAAAALGFLILAAIFDLRAYKNFTAPDAMDSAQLARNIALGRGFTTDLIRPFSVDLLRQHHEDRNPRLESNHPDLANAPVYPVVLAALFKIAPMAYEIPPRSSSPRYRPEMIVCIFNQLLFFSATLILFNLTARLFDRPVAWVTVLMFIASELLWRFSTSGLSTMLLMNFVLAFTWCLARLDQEHKDTFPSMKKILLLSIAAGVLLALAGLTRYSFLFLLIPALVFIALLAPQFRVTAGVGLLIPLLLLVAPWIGRNIVVSGTPFGTAGFAIYEGTLPLPEDTLQRSINSAEALNRVELRDMNRKLLVNTRTILQSDLPKLGGSWITAFFFVGLLVPFKNPTLSRLRLFVAISLLLFILVQAGGRTWVSDTSPEISGDNQLVIFAPLVFLFGVGFYFMMIDQLQLQFVAVRTAITTLLIIIVGLPLFMTLLQRAFPISYPPYFPPLVQQISRLMSKEELIMTDIPWATAWYGHRQSSMLTLNYDKEFNALHNIKPVRGLYFSPTTMDSNLLIDILRPTVRNQKPWPRFVWEAISRGQVPDGFPVTKSWLELLPDHLFLSDKERWRASAGQ